MKKIRELIENYPLNKRIIVIARRKIPVTFHCYSNTDFVPVVFNDERRYLENSKVLINLEIKRYYENEAFNALVIIVDGGFMDDYF